VQIRRFLLASLVLAAVSQLPGCAADPYGWHNFQERNSLPAVIRVVPLKEVRSHCPTSPSSTGCAVSDDKRGFCYVYIAPDVKPWTVSHELLHCAGWVHP
jgi:hypothetical protein